jgi:hypothetical protein
LPGLVRFELTHGKYDLGLCPCGRGLEVVELVTEAGRKGIARAAWEYPPSHRPPNTFAGLELTIFRESTGDHLTVRRAEKPRFGIDQVIGKLASE